MRDNIIISSNVTCSPMIELNISLFGVKLTHSNTVELNVQTINFKLTHSNTVELNVQTINFDAFMPLISSH